MVEKGLSGGQFVADHPVDLIAEGEESVKQESQDVEGGQRRGQMRFAVAEVVIKMVSSLFRVLLFSFSIFHRARPASAMPATF